MYCIIPLAGPEIDTNRTENLKPLREVGGLPLLKRTLDGRIWLKTGELAEENIFFVIRNGARVDYLQGQLKELYPKAQTVIIPSTTRGAALSALAATSQIGDYRQPLCVDLGDIIYEIPAAFSPTKLMTEGNYAGIIPYFQSDWEKFSYLEIAENNRVLRTREKELISTNASAGTYFFKDVTVFLEACARSLRNCRDYEYKGNMFVCPLYNELIKSGYAIYPLPVELKEMHS